MGVAGNGQAANNVTRMPAGFAEIIMELSHEVLLHQPRDVLLFCAQFFESKSTSASAGAGAGASASTSGKSRSTSSTTIVTAAVAPLHKDENEMGDDQPYDHSPLPSDDEEEADDFVPLPAITSNAAARGRRISVSAESMAPTADDYKKVDIPKTQEQRQRIAASVKNNFLFRNLDEDQYKDVVDAMAEKRAASGEDVIKQGAVGDFFYIVETGTLDVLVAKNGGAPVKVHHYVAGGSFGELALMYNAPRAATVTATSDCILWALDRMTFRRILMDSGEKKRRMYESFMEEVPLLKSLEANERHKIADSLEAVTFEDGQVVIKQGDAGDSFYFIVQGEAKVTQTDENGTEFALPGLKKGDYFGELALLSNKPRAATITAKGKLKCATLGKKAFDRLLGPALNIIKRNAGAYKALAHRKSIQDLIENIESGANNPVAAPNSKA